MLQSKLMKKRATTHTFKRLTTKTTLVVLAAILAVSAPMAIIPNAFARDYDAEINAIRNQIDGYQSETARLNKEAMTLENELARLDAEKNAIQADINLSQAQYDKLKADIKNNEIKIQDNKDALGVTLADMSVDASISPLEMLASSNNIGDYVDKQSYRSAVNDQLQETIEIIDKLKKQLEEQKVEVERVLLDQKNQRTALISKENERQSVLNATKGQEAAYQNLIKQSDQKIREVQSAQDAARAQALAQWQGGYVSTGGTGGYPWASPATQCWSSACVDPWDLFYRECVSYVAWRLDNQGYGVKKFQGAGHAYQWPSTTSGYATSHDASSGYTPKRGDAAVIPAWHHQIGHAYGHIMYVEAVYGDGRILISEFNWLASRYSERIIDPSFQNGYGGYTFITFPRK